MGVCGLLSFFILMICIGFSIKYSYWFSWTEHYLSELAGSPIITSIWATHHFPSIIFNVGLITAEMIGFIFSILIKKVTYSKKV